MTTALMLKHKIMKMIECFLIEWNLCQFCQACACRWNFKGCSSCGCRHVLPNASIKSIWNHLKSLWTPSFGCFWFFFCIFLAWGLRGQRDAAETWAASSALQIPCICPDGSSASGSIGLPRYWCLSMSQYSLSTRAQALVIFACQYFSTKQ